MSQTSAFQRKLVAALLGAAVSQACIAAARANDDIFPPAPAAKAVADFDGRGFIINGKRTFVASGSIHMARVPRALWRDRMLKLKRAGFNCVETYVFWNFHEARKGVFDFTGDRDLGAFLQTAQDVGLYAIVRVGPYVCAEWDSGGFPIWLRFEPGLKIRVDEPVYVAAVDRFWDKVLPIVASHQINHGGNVILVQLENEHPQGWGAEARTPYFTHLLEKARADGIEVPHFFSGLHHGSNPAEKPWKTAGRKSPWISTETWDQWYNKYGPGGDADARGRARKFWNEIAHGGNGFNIYMFHGGTNFAYTNDNEDAASYDYGAMVGQDGDLRPVYYRTKRATQLAASFSALFSDSDDAAGEYADFAAGAVVRARKGPEGTVVFLEAGKEAEARFKGGDTLKLESNETAAFVVDTIIAPGIKVATSSVRTLAVATSGKTTTWVVFALAGERGRIELALDQDGKAEPSGAQIEVKDPRRLTVHTLSPDEGAVWQCDVTAGEQKLRILVMRPELADRTWVVGEPGAQDVVVGPEFVGEYARKGGKVEMTIARTYGKRAPAVAVYGADAVTMLNAGGDPSLDGAAAPALSAWETSPASAPATTSFDDGGWKRFDAPPQMGVDGDTSAYAWYRASFKAPAAGGGTLHFGGIGDDAVVFLNGQPAGTPIAPPTPTPPGGKKAQPSPERELVVTLGAGTNVLAVFVSHHGRDKFFNHLGSIENYDAKGVLGPVTVQTSGETVPVTGWKLRGGAGEPDAAGMTWAAVDPPIVTEETTLAKSATGNATGKPSTGPAFFRTHFTAKPPADIGAHPIYRATFAGLSRGSVWINGHNVGRYPEKIPVDSVYLPECWLSETGDNTLAIFDEEGRAPAQVKLVTDPAASREIIKVGE